VVEAFLWQNAPSAGTRNNRLSLLRVFFRFLHRLGAEVPEDPEGRALTPRPPFRPHIFTLQEVGRILHHVRRRGEDSAHSIIWRGLEVILYLLYACGMRLSEPLDLRLQDVDLHERVLFVARAKFHKQRWIPFESRTARRLAEYLHLRREAFPDRNEGPEPFFLNSQGRRFSHDRVREAFRQSLETLGIRSRGTRPPRLHDFRHSHAVHRLHQWYSEGADVQNKLPLLCAYMGHINIHSTEVYLHLTEDLLRQAGGNFRTTFEQVVERWILPR
jgi:site-specific recombinase XerD